MAETALEPSFAEALRDIEASTELSERTRSHWRCSLRQIGKWIDRPLELIPARWTAARHLIGRLHHARIGSNPKTLANHKSNARAALCWFGKEENIPARGILLRPEGERLRSKLADRHSRSTLASLMRFCSAKGIPPEGLTDAVIIDFMTYRAATSALAVDNAARRGIARVWNGCAAEIAGWPSNLLTEPPLKAREGPALEDFPGRLRSEIDGYVAGLAKKGRRAANGKRLRPCQQSTLRTRHAELIAIARMAVRIGVPIESLNSLAALVDPSLAERIIDAYWKKDGEKPKVYTIDLSSKLVSAARATGVFSEAELARLDDFRASLEEHRRFGMTEKNLTLIRQVLSTGVWKEVINLPKAMMIQAREQRDHAPIHAAVTAQIAICIAILTFAPIRLGNLSQIELETNLTKPGGLNSPYWLVFPHYDVKNRVDLNFALDQQLTGLIDEYVHDFRPALLRGSNTRLLIPGETGGLKTRATLSDQISDRVKEATGISITAHQFRHAAAAFHLMHRPGDYETVRRLLGHRNIQTTIRFYCELTTIHASKEFSKLVRREADKDFDNDESE